MRFFFLRASLINKISVNFKMFTKHSLHTHTPSFSDYIVIVVLVCKFFLKVHTFLFFTWFLHWMLCSRAEWNDSGTVYLRLIYFVSKLKIRQQYINRETHFPYILSTMIYNFVVQRADYQPEHCSTTTLTSKDVKKEMKIRIEATEK